MGTAVKPKIVLLGQKDPAKEIELSPEEGPVESRLAVVQDMWGGGNLTPFDSPFASRAVGALAPAKSTSIGALCHHLGRRLFAFSRESGIWIDAYEADAALSRLEKRPKDKVKLMSWTPGSGQLGNRRFTHLAVLSPSRLKGAQETLVREAAKALKPEGCLFLADLMCDDRKMSHAGLPKLYARQQYRDWLEKAGLEFYNEHALSGDVRVALLRGLASSVNMLANVKKLQDPWRSQRFKAFRQELDAVVTLHTAMERGDVAAHGLLYIKKA